MFYIHDWVIISLKCCDDKPESVQLGDIKSAIVTNDILIKGIEKKPRTIITPGLEDKLSYDTERLRVDFFADNISVKDSQRELVRIERQGGQLYLIFVSPSGMERKMCIREKLEPAEGRETA